MQYIFLLLMFNYQLMAKLTEKFLLSLFPSGFLALKCTILIRTYIKKIERVINVISASSPIYLLLFFMLFNSILIHLYIFNQILTF
jgi:hypothetical protein